jgi:uncharacterized integral membrane protein
MRKIVTALILVPLLIVLVVFAVANRQSVTISFDPFDSAQPAFALTAPLFILIFMLVGAGAIVGGVSAWFGQRKWRVRARRAESDARALREQLAQRKWPPDQQDALPPPREQPSPLVFPPAA